MGQTRSFMFIRVNILFFQLLGLFFGDRKQLNGLFLKEACPLQSGQRLVDIDFPPSCDRVGHAPMSGGVVGLLERSI